MWNALTVDTQRYSYKNNNYQEAIIGPAHVPVPVPRPVGQSLMMCIVVSYVGKSLVFPTSPRVVDGTAAISDDRGISGIDQPVTLTKKCPRGADRQLLKILGAFTLGYSRPQT